MRSQKGVGKSSAVKAALTGVGLGVAGWSALLNRKMAAAGPVPVQGATEPGPGTPDDVARTQRQLQLVQWLNPAVGLALLAATAVHEGQQRAAQQVKGRLQGTLASPFGAGAATAVALVLLAARQRGTRRELEQVDVVEVTEVDVVAITDDGVAVEGAGAPDPRGRRT